MTDDRTLSPQALNRAVREAVDFVHAEGWDAPPTLFALVPTELVADALDPELLDESPLTVVVQEERPEGIDGGSPELSDFIARTSWPEGVVGAVLAQEILIVAPEDADAVEGDAGALEVAHEGLHRRGLCACGEGLSEKGECDQGVKVGGKGDAPVPVMLYSLR